MILLDTGGLFAALVQSQRHHVEAREALECADPSLVLSPFVLAELDYFILRHVGVELELLLLAEVAARRYELAAFAPPDVAEAAALVERYRDLGLGLADASIAVLADRLGADTVLTFDERHFRAIRTPAGRTLRLLPADA